MADLKIDIEYINSLMELVSKNDMGELVIENNGAKIKIAAKKPQPAASAVSSAPAAASAAQQENLQAGKAFAQPQTAGGKKVVSPIVGTFYAAPSPDRDPFVKVGQRVKKGDVLFIVESMKLMNEIQSEYDGEVAEILCTDGQAVEFGQTVVVLK